MIAVVVIFLTSLAGLLLMMGWKVSMVRSGAAVVSNEEFDEIRIVKVKTREFVTRAEVVAKRLWENASWQVLATLKGVFRELRVALFFVEQRIVSLMNTIKGKGSIQKRGSVSLYLQDIAKFKQETHNKEDKPE